MATYRSPGVYVEEVPSAVQPIAGVGTSTVGFVGIVPDRITIPKANPYRDPRLPEDAEIRVRKRATMSVEDLLGQEAIAPVLETLLAGRTITPEQAGWIIQRGGSVQVKYKAAAGDLLAGKVQVLDDDVGAKFTKGTPIDDGNLQQIKDALAAGKVSVVHTLDVNTIAPDWLKDKILAADIEVTTVTSSKQTLLAESTITLEQSGWIIQGGGSVRVKYEAEPSDLQAGKVQVLDGDVSADFLTGTRIDDDNLAQIRAALAARKVSVVHTLDVNTIAPDWLKDKILVMDVEVAITILQLATSPERLGEDDIGKLIQEIDSGKSLVITVKNLHILETPFPLRVNAKEPKLCTNFGEFKSYFGDFSTDPGQRKLAHAVYGFFNNGGTRCYVMCCESLEGLQAPDALEPFEAIDEIALVAAPSIFDETVQTRLLDHCRQLGDRFAILDSENEIEAPFTVDSITHPDRNDYGAFYFPWIKVYDPVAKLRGETKDGGLFVGPSGHIAGIYARVDTSRGVHKAPANETIRGLMDPKVKYPISKSVQDGLNLDGINCIRELNRSILVWGARTIGGDANGEWKYINVRRLFLFLRESIDEGTQWVVFEPNTPALWSKITRNITAFLTNVWDNGNGALFGATPQEAFYVKCDAETNPYDLRELGQVVTEIGVAVSKPAEFVIFRISQWAGSNQ